MAGEGRTSTSLRPAQRKDVDADLRRHDDKEATVAPLEALISRRILWSGTTLSSPMARRRQAALCRAARVFGALNVRLATNGDVVGNTLALADSTIAVTGVQL
jgi:hypothetical protein